MVHLLHRLYGVDAPEFDYLLQVLFHSAYYRVIQAQVHFTDRNPNVGLYHILNPLFNVHCANSVILKLHAMFQTIKTQ